MKPDVPVWEKIYLTFDEAAALFGIGIGKIRFLAENDPGQFSMRNGKKWLIRRKQFEQFLSEKNTI